MNTNGTTVRERLWEANMVCARQNPIHEQISHYGIPLYVLGTIDAPDILSVEEVDMWNASDYLKENFARIDLSEIPPDYSVSRSDDRYLLVLGDPDFPLQFAAVMDMGSDTPFFSKSRHMGSGFDGLKELISDVSVDTDLPTPDVQYYKAI